MPLSLDRLWRHRPAAMQPTFGNAAALVTPQPLYVPAVTSVVPQVWPGVPRVRGQGAQLPPGGPPPSVRQLPPWGLHPGTAPPAAPAHRWGHPLQAGTPQPPQPMGLWPGAVFHAQPPQPAGGCPLQDPHRRVLPPAPPAQQQGLPAPCTLPASWQQAPGPFADAVVLTEGQGHPAPTHACPQPTAAPLGCSGAALDSGAATASADVAEDVADLLPWISGECGVCRGGGWASAPTGGGKAGSAPASRSTPRRSTMCWRGSATKGPPAQPFQGTRRTSTVCSPGSLKRRVARRSPSRHCQPSPAASAPLLPSERPPTFPRAAGSSAERRRLSPGPSGSRAQGSRHPLSLGSAST
ncbi:fidgetin-like protein 2 [Tympanuchus pallidicinctus]|uniref:fidgetin-like protein 2 n=1 Tax=Tympanuchus pallidicinctus TaxID=109042 RepID=UPI0022871636|nr:fidgetin-like protein 2 [Tympanuchus pallidicinctus]